MNYEIIGCGSADRGDDAAGLLVVRRLRELGIEAREHCADGAALIESWSGQHPVILIDAVVTGGPLGELTVWDGSKAPVIAGSLRSSTHAFSVAEALMLARVLGRMPPRLLIYGIEGRRFDLGCAPSPEVIAAAGRLAVKVASDLRPPILRRAVPILVSLALVAPLGFYTKRGYHGPAAEWVHDSLGGAVYEIFWCLVLALMLPRWRPARIAIVVLMATCILEFLQLWHPPLLEWLRSFFIGHAILGSYFDWFDFPYYFAGSAAGWLWLRAITPRSR